MKAKKLAFIIPMAGLLMLTGCGGNTSLRKSGQDTFHVIEGMSENKDTCSVSQRKFNANAGTEITGETTTAELADADTSNYISEAKYQIFSGEDGVNSLRIVAGVKLDNNDDTYTSNYAFGFHISDGETNCYFTASTIYNSIYSGDQIYANSQSAFYGQDGVKAISDLFGGTSYTHFISLTIHDIPDDYTGTVFQIQSAYNDDAWEGGSNWVSSGNVRYTSYQKTSYLDDTSKEFAIVNDDTSGLQVFDVTVRADLTKGDKVSFYSAGEVTASKTVPYNGSYSLADLKNDATLIRCGANEYTLSDFNSLNEKISASLIDNVIVLTVDEEGATLTGEIDSNGKEMKITGGALTVEGSGNRDCIKTEGANLTIDCSLTISLEGSENTNNTCSAINIDNGSLTVNEGKQLVVSGYKFGIYASDTNNINISSGNVLIYSTVTGGKAICNKSAEVLVYGNVSLNKALDFADTFTEVTIDGSGTLSITTDTNEDALKVKKLTLAANVEIDIASTVEGSTKSALTVNDDSTIKGTLKVSNYKYGIYVNDGKTVTIEGNFEADNTIKYGIGTWDISANANAVIKGTVTLNSNEYGFYRLMNLTVEKDGSITSAKACYAQNNKIYGKLDITGQLTAGYILLDGGTLNVTTNDKDAITIEGTDLAGSEYQFTSGTVILKNTNSDASATAICNSKSGEMKVVVGESATVLVDNFYYGVGQWNGSGTLTNNGVFATYHAGEQSTGVSTSDGTKALGLIRSYSGSEYSYDASQSAYYNGLTLEYDSDNAIKGAGYVNENDYIGYEIYAGQAYDTTMTIKLLVNASETRKLNECVKIEVNGVELAITDDNTVTGTSSSWDYSTAQYNSTGLAIHLNEGYNNIKITFLRDGQNFVKIKFAAAQAA